MWLDCHTQGCVRGILGEKHWWSVRAYEMGYGIQTKARLGAAQASSPSPGAIIGEAAILLPTGPWEQRGALRREQPGGYAARMTALGWIHSFVGLGVVLMLNAREKGSIVALSVRGQVHAPPIWSSFLNTMITGIIRTLAFPRMTVSRTARLVSLLTFFSKTKISQI